ncbi:cytidine deaminase-like protein [Poronia punctata]|nr:cytidine deaminase-like protein [Poronia punctata]
MASSFAPTDVDMTHLRRAIALAAESLQAGDAPFGSVLVDRSGNARHEDRNRIHTLNDGTRHPEFELARWAATNLDAEERAGATVYTSGEHCAMCSAAHAWVGLGKIVYVAGAKQLDKWVEEEFGKGGSEGDVKGMQPVNTLDIQTVAPGIEVHGPVKELEADIKELHRRWYAGR